MRLPVALLALAACQAQAVDGDVEVYEADHAELFCGTREPTNALKMSIENATDRMPHDRDTAPTGGMIDVYVHVIVAEDGAGDVSDDAIATQIRVLDTAFDATGFGFRLVSIDRTVSRAWVAMQPGTPAEKQAKAALKQGSARDLNLYIAEPGAGLAGFATFPADYAAAPSLDGVVVAHSTMPGGSAAPYNLGDQAVHQVGHWLGLYHTYQAACGDHGDLVSDTPSTNAPAFGCPVGRDTCGDDDNMDPVRNYMDATDDLCMNSFTAGQRARIDRQFTAYRRF